MQRLSTLWQRPLSQRCLLATQTAFRLNSKPDSTLSLLQNSCPKRLLVHTALKMSPSIHERPSAKETFGNFDLIKRVKLDYTDVTVSKWRSRVTGLGIVHLDYQAPIVSGYFVVPTEIFDDSGCPHTLEHLVFMGSEKYPYKGIIDNLANRGFADGTNAWTATDHTAYTVNTAGEQGFLQILPIYVDHILYPTLTKAGFVTEVHHIDPKGHDSGVVYSEMQGRENTALDLMAFRTRRLLNPAGSAYRSETGGLMENLRVLTIEQIRKYHSTYYVPHNLSLVVAGKLTSGTSSLLSVAQEKIEPSLIAHGQDLGPHPPGWKRPFLETASAKRDPIQKTIKDTVEFPEQDESVGELILNFIGPPRNDYLKLTALDLLGTYLTSSSVAPLTKEYVEVESPLCTYIAFDVADRATLADLCIYIGSVPTEHLDTFDDRLKDSLKRIVKEGIDMDRMSKVINRDERQFRNRLESAKGDEFSSTVIADFIYGPDDGSELQSSMDDMKLYTEVRRWTSDQWTDLLQIFYIDSPSVVICGKPSAKLAEKLERDERLRTAAQVQRLGPEGLKNAERVLEEAKIEHDRPVPADVLTSFPVPDVKSISWLSVQSLQERGNGRTKAVKKDMKSDLANHIQSDGSDLPFFVQYDHVQSDFVTVHAYLSMVNLPDRLRPYMLTYHGSFFGLPVKRQSGEHLTHEQVVKRLDDETVVYEANFGTNDQFTNLFRVTLRVETALYETAIVWLKDLIYGSEFNKERLQVTLAKIQQSLPQAKREGDVVLGALCAELLFDTSSISRENTVLTQVDFIPKLLKQLQESPDEVIKDFNEVRKHLTDPAGIRFAVSGNVLSIKEPRSTWGKYFATSLPGTMLSPVPVSSDTLSAMGKTPVKKAIVMGLPTIESSFVQHTSKGIQSFDSPEYPALRIAQEVLNASEGYLWRYIRGSGLAYGASVSMDLEAGLSMFTLYRSSNSTKAFEEAATVVKGLVDGSIPLQTTTLDAAKSTVVYAVVRGVSTAGRAANVSFVNQTLKGVSQNFQVELLEKFQAVTKEDVISALRKHFLPLFDSSSSVAVVVTAPSKVEAISADLTTAGFEVEKRTLEVDPTDLDDCSESESDTESEENSGR